MIKKLKFCMVFAWLGLGVGWFLMGQAAKAETTAPAAEVPTTLPSETVPAEPSLVPTPTAIVPPQDESTLPGQLESQPENKSAEQKPDSLQMELMMVSEDVLITTATKRQQKLSQVPGNVTIITQKDIREAGALTLKEVLYHVAGVEFEIESTLEASRFRGIQSSLNNKILVLINGRKIHTVDWGNAEYNFGTNLDNVKQIEIIKGPASSLYGANAFAGVINIITLDGAEINGVDLRAAAGYHTVNENDLSQYYSLTYGRKIKDYTWDLWAGYWRYFDMDFVNSDRDRPNNLYDGEQVHMGMKYQDEWIVHAGLEKTRQPYPGHYGYPDPTNFNQQMLFYADGKYLWQLDESSRLSFFLEDTFYPYREALLSRYQVGRKKINSLADLPSDVNILIDESGRTYPLSDAVGDYYVGLIGLQGLQTGKALKEVVNGGSLQEATAEVQYDLSWPENNYFISGLSFMNNWAWLNCFKEESVMDMNYAVYLQDEYQAWDNLTCLAGLRFDYNTDYGSNLSPRGSVIFTPLADLRLKAIYGSAFRAPELIERYAKADYGLTESIGNIDLKPEKIEQSEAVIEWKADEGWQLKGAYFYWETKDEIQFILNMETNYIYSSDLSLIDPTYPAEGGLLYMQALNLGYPSSMSWTNIDSRIGRGFELESSLSPWSFVQWQVNYSQFDLYSRHPSQHPAWEEGEVKLLNNRLGFYWGTMLFANFYAHLGHSPRKNKYAGTQLINLTRYDATLGGHYENWRVTLAVQNLFENAVGYNTEAYDVYVKWPRIWRLIIDYHIAF